MRIVSTLRRVPPPLWAIAAVLVTLALLVAAAPPPRPTPLADPAAPMVDGWEYRWGDSPREDGAFLWMRDEADGAWRSFRPPEQPRGREGRSNLWLRVRLPRGPARSATLFLQTVDQVFEAYIDGARIGGVGRFDEDGVGHDFPGYTWRLIALPDGYEGKILYLRIYSRHTNIGVGGSVMLSSTYGVWAFIVQADAARSFIAAMSFFAGLVALVVYLARPHLWPALSYAIYAIGAGVYLFARTNIRIILSPDALRWNHAELSSLYLFPVGIFAYLDSVFGSGWKGSARFLWRALAAYAAVAIAGAGLGAWSLLQTLFPWQCMMMVALPFFALNVVVVHRRGDVEGRIMTVGLALGTAFSMFDLANAMGLFGRIPSSLVLAHYGSLLFTGALGAVLVRRYFEFLAAARERARLDGELMAARVVQQALLPPPLEAPGITVATCYAPATQTGGDWYGYHYDQVRGRVHLYVGDVTGHGLSSALLAGVAAGAVSAVEHTLVSRNGGARANPEEELSTLARVCNHVIYNAGRHELEMTMAFVSLDATTGEVVYLSAGHVPLVWVHASERQAAPVPNRGTRLGSREEVATQAKRFRMAPGDMLFLYTDGLVENCGPAGERLRLRELLALLAAAPSPAETRARVTQEMTTRWGDVPQGDDVTFLALRWDGPAQALPAPASLAASSA